MTTFRALSKFSSSLRCLWESSFATCDISIPARSFLVRGGGLMGATTLGSVPLFRGTKKLDFILRRQLKHKPRPSRDPAKAADFWQASRVVHTARERSTARPTPTPTRPLVGRRVLFCCPAWVRMRRVVANARSSVRRAAAPGGRRAPGGDGGALRPRRPKTGVYVTVC